MSEFHVEVAEIKNVQKHPNADTLSIAEVNGYPVIFRTGEYAEGQLAVHVPIDSIVPDLPEWAFLAGHRRIKAKRLRGIFSMGMLSKARPEWTLGQNVQVELGIEKWEPSAPATMGGDDARDAGILPIYTDIEGYRRHKYVLAEGEEVVITEKIHGANARFCWHDGELIVGSHKRIKKVYDTAAPSMWARVAIELGLDKKLAEIPDVAIYGEVYGQVQDLKYGKAGTELVLFDAMDLRTRSYLDRDAFLAVAEKLGLPTVPQLYRGPWSVDLLALSEGPSTVPGANNIREGFVVKPVRERFEHMGRVILKMVGEGYLLRKAA
jgi:RNA ligase (TIGR02306 family)